MPFSTKNVTEAARRAVVELVNQGRTNKEIASKISVHPQIVTLLKVELKEEILSGKEVKKVRKKAKPAKTSKPKKKPGRPKKRVPVSLLPKDAEDYSPKTTAFSRAEGLAHTRQPASKATTLRRYRREISKNLSLEERANILAGLARTGSDQVAMRALERIDAIDGIDAQVKKQNERPEENKGPVFIFPPGSGISMSPPVPIQALPKEDEDVVDGPDSY